LLLGLDVNWEILDDGLNPQRKAVTIGMRTMAGCEFAALHVKFHIASPHTPHEHAMKS
jgi:hypothetical protein